MSRQPRLVAADAERQLWAAGRFVAVTFALAAAAYLPLLAGDLGWIAAPPPALQIVGILSPGFAALGIRLYDDGLDGARNVLAGLAAWRFGRVWWAVTLALPPAFALVLAAGSVVLGQAFTPQPAAILAEVGPAILLLVVVSVLLAFGEEAGWRGHLLPLLQARLGALAASLVLGVVWAVWHLPLFYGAGLEGWVLALRLLSTLPGAVVYTWLFNNTGGSVLAVTLLHAGINLWGRLLAPVPTEQPAATVFTAEITLLALVVIAVYGGATLAGRRLQVGPASMLPER